MEQTEITWIDAYTLMRAVCAQTSLLQGLLDWFQSSSGQSGPVFNSIFALIPLETCT